MPLRTAAALALLVLTVAAAAAQPAPFHGTIRSWKGEVLSRIDEVGDTVVVLQNGAQQVSIPSFHFQSFAIDYVEFADTMRAPIFQLGIMRGRFRFSFEQRALFVGGLFLGGAVVIFGFIALFRNRRRIRRLREERARVIAQRRIVEQGQETERQRLARDLHDGPLQALYALRMQLARRTPDLAAQDFAIEQIAEHLRGVTAALRSPLLAPFGLASALQDLASAYPGTELCPMIDTGTERLLDEQARNTLFRVAQEAISNAVRHGGASRIDLHLGRNRGEATLTIRDNGTGFDPSTPLDAYGAAGHYGLVGMRERVEVLGGAVTLQSGPQGTQVDVRVPLSMVLASGGDGASSIAEVQSFP